MIHPAKTKKILLEMQIRTDVCRPKAMAELRRMKRVRFGLFHSYHYTPPHKGEGQDQFCTRTPSITTVEAVLVRGMLESSTSRRTVPFTHKLRVIL